MTGPAQRCAQRCRGCCQMGSQHHPGACHSRGEGRGAGPGGVSNCVRVQQQAAAAGWQQWVSEYIQHHSPRPAVFDQVISQAALQYRSMVSLSSPPAVPAPPLPPLARAPRGHSPGSPHPGNHLAPLPPPPRPRPPTPCGPCPRAQPGGRGEAGGGAADVRRGGGARTGGEDGKTGKGGKAGLKPVGQPQ